MSLIILQVIPSLIGYIIIVLNFNCATWSFFPEHNFRRWAKLTSIFLIISFRLEQQAWFWVCVVLMVPITFRFIIPLTWCHHRSNYIFMKSLDNCVVIIISILSSSRVSRIHDEKYHPFPRWFVLSSTTLLPSVQHKLVRVLCYTLSSLLSSICSSLSWSITIFYVKDVVRIAPPLKVFLVLWCLSPSPFFLVPCCF